MNPMFIVDDDPAILDSLQNILYKNGYEVRTAESPEQFLKQIGEEEPSVAILDVVFGGANIDGEELVKLVGERCPNTQCIMMSGESDIEKALSCLREGALDFLEKPVSLPRLLTSVKNAYDIYNARSSAQGRFKILGQSRAVREVMARIRKIARLNESVLILGESGTGKELVADNLHLFSNRYTLPMVKVNCAALNPNLLESELFGHRAGSFTGARKDKQGYFERAHKSSLFIDEIGDFPGELQSKILRVLQEKVVMPVGGTQEIPIDVRLVFATHHDLEVATRQGSFREDLYFRISTFTIKLPPLRERPEDIDLLADHFLTGFIRENNLTPKTFNDAARARLTEYHYPGNIRELANIVKNAAFFAEGDEIRPDDIVFTPGAGKSDLLTRTREMPLTDAKKLLERELLLYRLRVMNFDIKKTAESFGILANNLYRKLREADIDWENRGR